MRIGKSVRTLLLLCGACAVLAGTAAASGSVSVFVDGKRLDNAWMDGGKWRLFGPWRKLWADGLLGIKRRMP